MADVEVDSVIDFGIFGRYIGNNSAKGTFLKDILHTLQNQILECSRYSR